MKNFLVQAKIQDEIQHLDKKYVVSHFKELLDIDLEDIISSYNHKKSSKAVFSAFLNGEQVDASENELREFIDKKKTTSLKRSYRITHLETFFPKIMEFCKRTYEESGILITCGIYITPNENSQCFLYHSDHQHIFAYQMSGEKRWSFPKISEDPLKEYSLTQLMNKSINEKTTPFKSHEINLREGEILYIPYGTSHCAFNDSSGSSVHLTFAEEDISLRDVMTFLTEEVLGIKSPDARFFEEIEPIALEKELIPYNANDALKKADFYYQRMKIQKFKFGLRS